MGMFDSVIVARKVLQEIMPENLREPLVDSKGYYAFQTKDLDNYLENYYIEEDHKVYKVTYSYDNPDQPPTNRFLEKLTQRIEFYTYEQDVNGENVWLSFECVIINGEVIEINLKEDTRQSTAEIEAGLQANRERWEKIQATVEWQIYHFLSEAEWFFKRLLRPLLERYSTLKNYLREKAEEKYPEL